MRVLKVESRDYKRKTYYKYIINIPEDILHAVEFNQGDELIAEARNGEIKLRRKLK